MEMNTKLVDSLAQIIDSLTSEEKKLLEEKINFSVASEKSPFYETATPIERAKAYREWAESHPHDSPMLSDEAISREAIYGERG